MRRALRWVLIVASSLLCSFTAQGKTVSVTLVADRYEQDPAQGYNLVELITQCIHEKVGMHEWQLLSAPNSTLVLDSSSLSAIERANGVELQFANKIFLYEQWEVGKRSLETRLLGISIIATNAEGRDVLLGHIALIDYMRKDLEQIALPKRLALNYNMTLGEAIQYHDYQSIITFYDGKAIVDVRRSVEIEETVMRRNWNQKPAPTRRLHVRIESAPNAGGSNSRRILSCIDLYFSKQPQEFLNMGGEHLSKFPDVPPISFDALELSGIATWKDGAMRFEWDSATLYYRGMPLYKLPRLHAESDVTTVDRWLSYCPDYGKYIYQLDCHYRILYLNDIKLKPRYSSLYREVLQSGNWTLFTEW